MRKENLESVTDETLGDHLAALRSKRGLSLRQLASLAGVATSFLSKVEKGGASPTFSTLSKILAALDVDVSEFFTRDSVVENSNSIIFKKENMRIWKEVDRKWWYTFPGHSDILAIMTYEEYKKDSGTSEMESHRTDFMGYVITGELTLELPGVGTFKAAKGDSFYIKANQKHISRNMKKEILKMVVVQLK